MLPPAHIEFTWAVTDLVQKKLHRWKDVDFRLMALAAILPDLIDKPLAVFVFPESHAALLYAHTLILHIAAWAAAMKSPWKKVLLPYLLAFSGHLIGDRIWLFGQTFLYPFKGRKFLEWRNVGSVRDFGKAYADIAREEPILVYFEIIGLVLLWVFAKENNLYEKRRLLEFLRTGRFLESEK